MVPMMILIAASLGWPSLIKDCSIFPELGEPQKRPQNHAPMSLFCEPHPPASFEYCGMHCAMHGPFQNCSRSLCTCKERCMGTADVCTGSGASKMASHKSLPRELDARAGSTTLLLDGKPPSTYQPGRTYSITVSPSSNADNATWFLLDAGIGKLSASSAPGLTASQWRTQCNGTRASFSSGASVDGVSSSNSKASVAMLWAVPKDAYGPAVLRVATATSMGNVTINAAILNRSATIPPLPLTEIGYACTVSGASAHAPWKLQQCQSVPAGTVGAVNMSTCEAACFKGPPSATYRCTRCAHVYDAERDGNGVPFEDLPEDWKCPTCGAPKSAYAKQEEADGTARWAHASSERE